MIEISQVQPPIQLEAASSQANISIGPNMTSAFVQLNATTNEQLLISNPDFYTGADGWYVSRPDYNLGAAWIYGPDYGEYASGGEVLIYNISNVSQISDSWIHIYQNFTVPEDVSSVRVIVRYRLASEPSIYLVSFSVSIYDWDSGQSINLYNNYESVSSSYNIIDTTGNVDLIPGKTYAFYFTVRLQRVYYWIDNPLYFLVDYAYLYYTPAINRFTEDVVGIYSNQTVYAKLSVITYNCTGDMNMSIILYNSTDSTSIDIINGVLANTETDWITIYESTSSIYYDSKIRVEVESEGNATCDVSLYLVYTPETVLVYYPIDINVTAGG